MLGCRAACCGKRSGAGRARWAGSSPQAELSPPLVREDSSTFSNENPQNHRPGLVIACRVVTTLTAGSTLSENFCVCLQTCSERCALTVLDHQRIIAAAACLSLLMTAGQVRPDGFHSNIQTGIVKRSATTPEILVSPSLFTRIIAGLASFAQQRPAVLASNAPQQMNNCGQASSREYNREMRKNETIRRFSVFGPRFPVEKNQVWPGV